MIEDWSMLTGKMTPLILAVFFCKIIAIFFVDFSVEASFTVVWEGIV